MDYGIHDLPLVKFIFFRELNWLPLIVNLHNTQLRFHAFNFKILFQMTLCVFIFLVFRVWRRIFMNSFLKNGMHFRLHNVIKFFNISSLVLRAWQCLLHLSRIRAREVLRSLFRHSDICSFSVLPVLNHVDTIQLYLSHHQKIKVLVFEKGSTCSLQ